MSEHTCHHPECERRVPPKMLACRPHWFQLPRSLRDSIWAHYRPGQEIDKGPSVEYLAAMHDCISFWRSAR